MQAKLSQSNHTLWHHYIRVLTHVQAMAMNAVLQMDAKTRTYVRTHVRTHTYVHTWYDVWYHTHLVYTWYDTSKERQIEITPMPKTCTRYTEVQAQTNVRPKWHHTARDDMQKHVQAKPITRMHAKHSLTAVNPSRHLRHPVNTLAPC